MTTQQRAWSEKGLGHLGHLGESYGGGGPGATNVVSIKP